jgi:hypothetical protein
VSLDGHHGEVFDPWDVSECESVPKHYIGVLHVILASHPVGNSTRSASGLVGVLNGTEQLAVAVGSGPDVVLSERGAGCNVCIGGCQAHL